MFGLSLSSLGVRIATYAIAGLLAAAAASYITHGFDNAKYEKLELAQADAQKIAVEKAAAVQAATDKIALDAAVAEARAQQKIVVQHDVLTKEIDTYVPVHVSCFTYGTLRVLGAANLGTDPSNLTLPAGKSDDECAPVDVRSVVDALLANHFAFLQNAEQLNALEAWVRETVKASAEP